MVTIAPRVSLEIGGRGPGEQERGCEVGGQHVVPARQRGLRQRPEFADAGIRHDGVDAAEARPRHRNQPLDVRLPADVALCTGDRRPISGADRRQRVAIHVCARARASRARARWRAIACADALRRASHDDARAQRLRATATTLLLSS